jgi:hypothetical protein
MTSSHSEPFFISHVIPNCSVVRNLLLISIEAQANSRELSQVRKSDSKIETDE